MADKATKPDLRFVVQTKEVHYSEGTLELVAEIAVMTDEGLRFPHFGWSDATGAGDYEGLQVRAHRYVGDAHWIYGAEPEAFGIYSIGERHAASLTRTLKRLGHRLQQLNDRLGYSNDLASHLARLAIAVGTRETTCFGRPSSESWDGSGYKWMDASGLQMHLDQVVRDWKKKKGIND
jgi:hypothetical protein